MSLSRDEECFIRHWMYDEVHYRDGVGPAKRLQVQMGVAPADLAVLIAAAIPDPTEQEGAGAIPPPVEVPSWPWTEDQWKSRISEARAALAAGARDATHGESASIRQEAHIAGS